MQDLAQGQQEQRGQSSRPASNQTTPPPLPTLLQSTPPALQAQRVTAGARYGITTLAPPALEGRIILPRADDVSTVLRMLGETQVSAVVLTGDAGAGKSTLAALAFRQLQAAAQAGSSPFRHFTWLGLGANSSIPDCLAALLSSLHPDPSTSTVENALPPDFMQMKPEQQLAYTQLALRQPQASALVVIDQFEELLDFETGQALPGRGATGLFFQMLKQDLGASRVLLTCYRSPFGAQNDEQSRAKASMISHVSTPEGMALLQQRGVVGSSQELSLVWQRCAGNVYGLTLFAALFKLSGFSLSYLLNAPDYQYMWNGDVPLNLVGMVYNFLNPIQRTLLRALCLFNEPAPMEGILAAITGDGQSIDTLAFERELAAMTRLALVQYLPGERKERRESVTGQPRYFLHERIRQYTIEHYLEGHDRRHSGGLLSDVGVTDEPNPVNVNPEAREIALAAGHMRVASYYAHQSQAHCPPQEQRSGPLDVAPLLAVMEHLCLGWRWQQAYDVLLEERLHERLEQWGAWHTLMRLYTAMIPPAGIVTRGDEAFICGHLGLLYSRLGDYQAGDFYLQQALSTQREIRDAYGAATTLINQGELLRSAGQAGLARAAFEQASALVQQLSAQASPDARLESALLHNMGMLAQDEKDYNQALRYYLEALRLARSLPETYNLGMSLTNTGMLLFEQGRLPEALSLLAQALQVRQAAQDPTVKTLVLFLQALEQKLGPAAYAQLQQDAQRLQG
jgi:tetratricopeptide (TPR) repeat protein